MAENAEVQKSIVTIGGQEVALEADPTDTGPDDGSLGHITINIDPAAPLQPDDSHSQPRLIMAVFGIVGILLTVLLLCRWRHLAGLSHAS